MKNLKRKILKRMGLEKETKSKTSKEEMRRKAVASGVCPKMCEKCAWGIKRN
ncbi:hypothetical protein [Blautia argi]|uniref:hypothetical protein n=1 Tax=Blautia argi TaxID=1912897 RepID=UPI002943AA06|nr:hypothetical protein [Blautia argi]